MGESIYRINWDYRYLNNQIVYILIKQKIIYHEEKLKLKKTLYFYKLQHDNYIYIFTLQTINNQTIRGWH